jgi:hypothetical protein
MTAPQLNNQRTWRAQVLHELPAVLILAATAVLCSFFSWRTWPDVLVDFGGELYIPWRLEMGEVLYRDIAWVTGPVSVYFNALLFRLFGVSLTTLIVANHVILAAIVGLLYLLFRRCGTRRSATVVCVFFLACLAFSQYALIGNYNYICPYRHDLTHGFALALLHLLSLVEFGKTGRSLWLVSGGLCLGLVTLAKVELALAAYLVTAAALLLFALRKVRVDAAMNGTRPTSELAVMLKSCRWLARWGIILAAAAAMPMTLSVAALAGSLGWRQSVQHIFLQYRLALTPGVSSGSGFYRQVSGFDYVSANLLQMFLTVVFVLSGAVAAYTIGTWGLRRRKPSTGWSVGLWFLTVVCLQIVVHPDFWREVPMCLPLLLPLVIVVAWREARRESADEETSTVVLLLAVFSFGLLPKILLNVGFSHYGFVLAAPGILVLIHVVQQSIPNWLSRKNDAGWCFRAITAGALTVYGFTCVVEWLRIDAAKTVTIGEAGDRFWLEPTADNRTLPTVRTLAWLREHVQPDDTLVVFPNGAMLNYLLRVRNPTPYLMFSPWESDVHGGEQLVADTVIRAKPDYAVIVTMPMAIHGRGEFGSPEFGGQIVRFLEDQYDIVYQDEYFTEFLGVFATTVYHRRANQD